MKRNVFICGYGGSGKSSLVDILAKKFKLNAVHSSRVMREMMGLNSKNPSFWDKEAGLQLLAMRSRNYELDKKLDRHLKELASKGGTCMDSWTMPWLSKESKDVRIWLNASSETRAKRIAKRDKTRVEDAVKVIRERDEKNFKLYYAMYGIRYGDDVKPFDLVLNTDQLSQKQVAEIVSTFVKIALKAKK